MNKLFLSLIVACLCLVCTQQLLAQKKLCGYDLAVKSMEAQYPGYKAAVDKTFEQAKQRGAESRLHRSSVVYTIPVVVHVVWKEAEENIPDSLITSQIEVLNEDYRRTNADAGNIRPMFENVVGDAEIEFDLISIERVQTNSEFMVDLTGGLPDAVKVTAQGGSDAWDTNEYLNIWVCQIQPLTIAGIPLGQVLGYAYPPAGLANWPPDVSAPSAELDGVVIDYRVMGRNSPFEVDLGMGSPIKTQGRTPTHEVGHFLGLRHAWGDGGDIFGGSDSCDADDGVDDTPNTGSQANFDCDTSRNTCTDASNDLPDMIENYMDYAAEDCMNSFTQGQIDIMRGVLENERAGLIDGAPPTSTSSLDLSDQFRIAPNPTTGLISFQTGIVDIENYSVQLFSLSGQLMNTSMDFNANTMDLNAMENGLYILKLQSGNRQIVKKISVMK